MTADRVRMMLVMVIKLSAEMLLIYFTIYTYCMHAKAYARLIYNKSDGVKCIQTKGNCTFGGGRDDNNNVPE